MPHEAVVIASLPVCVLVSEFRIPGPGAMDAADENPERDGVGIECDPDLVCASMFKAMDTLACRRQFTHENTHTNTPEYTHERV